VFVLLFCCLDAFGRIFYKIRPVPPEFAKKWRISAVFVGFLGIENTKNGGFLGFFAVFALWGSVL
jgi:hypothetical protein